MFFYKIFKNKIKSVLSVSQLRETGARELVVSDSRQTINKEEKKTFKRKETNNYYEKEDSKFQIIYFKSVSYTWYFLNWK